MGTRGLGLGFLGWVLVALGALVFTGCGSDPGVAAAPPPAYATALEPRLESLRKDMLAPGAVVLVRSPELGDWTATFGHRDLAKTSPIEATDHLRIGSNTKTWTGTVILQLVDEGRLQLSDPISKFVPGVPNGDEITIEHLLAMRSGLFNYTEALALNQELDTNPTRAWEPKELLDLAFAEPPLFAPGAQFMYSNTNTVLLGLVIEKATGMPVEQAFKERIFDRLGLTETLLPARSSNEIPPPHPRGYLFGTNVETIESQVLPPAEQDAAKAGTLLPSDVTDENPSWGWTAGSGISTAPELVTYVRALVGGGLLSDDLQARRLASVQPIDPNSPASAGYGWALAKFGALYGHTGELPGFNTFMGHDPARDLTIIVWSNLAAAPDGRPPAVTMARAIIDELYAGGT